MVSLDVHRGMELVEALERAKLKIGVALWMYLSEYEDWRLVLSARQFDSLNLRDAYRLLHDFLDPAGEDPSDLDPSDDRSVY